MKFIAGTYDESTETGKTTAHPTCTAGRFVKRVPNELVRLDRAAPDRRAGSRTAFW